MLKMRRLFCDWHVPAFLEEVQLDVDYFVDQMAAMKAQSLLMMVKTAFGNCLYPTDVGYRTPALGDRDLIGELLQRADRKGLEFHAYYNMLLNDYLAKDHPEWQQVDVNGKPLKSFYYHVFCMNNKAFTAYLLSHIREILARYAVKGMFFDITYFNPRGCFCDACREDFQRRFGYPLAPADFKNLENWRDFLAFQRESRRRFVSAATQCCREMRDGIQVTWNGSGSPALSAWELDAEASFLSSEAHPPSYSECAAKARWMRGAGKEFAFTLPETINSWGDWTLMNAHTMKMLCSIAMANGGGIELNHTPMPGGDYGGRAFPAVYEVLGETLEWVAQRETLCAGKSTVPVAAILHSIENLRLKQAYDAQAQYSPTAVTKPRNYDRALGLDNTLLAAQFFDELHIPCDVLYSENDPQRWADYELIVLPNVGYMSEQTAQALRDYVSEGGVILASYNTSLLDENGRELPDFRLEDVLGTTFTGYAPYSVNYIDQFDESLSAVMPQIPLLVKDGGYNEPSFYPAIYCRLAAQAMAAARFTEPLLEADLEGGRHIYHDHAPPGYQTDFPAIIVNNFGKGKSLFMPFALWQTYGRYGGLWLRGMVKALCAWAGVGRKVSIDASPAVQAVLTQDEQAWYLHLIYVAKDRSSVLLDDKTAAGEIECRIAPPWPVGKVSDALSGQAMAFSRSGEAVLFRVTNLRDHAIVKISKA